MSLRTSASKAILLTAGTGLLGCGTTERDVGGVDDPPAEGGASGGGGSGGAGSPGGGGGALGPPGPCIDIEPTCVDEPAGEFNPWAVLLEATDVGAGAQFTAMGGLATLARLGDGSWQIAVLPALDVADQTVRIVDFPDQRIEVVGVQHAWGAGLASAVCNEDQTGCRLYRLGADDLEGGNDPLVMSEVIDSVLPAGYEPSGVVYDPTIGRFCVFGSGLLCWDESLAEWDPAIPAETDLEIVDVAFGVQPVVVGAGGRWWRWNGPSAWTEQSPLTVDLRGAAQLYDSAALLGSGALWVLEGQRVRQCTLPDHVVAVFRWDMVLSDGNLLQYGTAEAGRSGWCARSGVEFVEDVIAVTTAPCADSPNFRVLTPSRVVGRNTCFIED